MSKVRPSASVVENHPRIMPSREGGSTSESRQLEMKSRGRSRRLSGSLLRVHTKPLSKAAPCPVFLRTRSGGAPLQAGSPTRPHRPATRKDSLRVSACQNSQFLRTAQRASSVCPRGSTLNVFGFCPAQFRTSAPFFCSPHLEVNRTRCG